ncbi:MAG: hypothetical protein ACOCWI_04380 [Bacillota bacterium]
MTIFTKKIKLTEKDKYTHMNIPFEVFEEANKLILSFSYFPKFFYDKKKSLQLVREGLARYAPEKTFSDEDLQRFLPIKNLLTVTLDSPKGVVGTAHKQSEEQQHIISENHSSQGFLKQKIIKGKWNITVSSHSIVSPVVDVMLEVAVE